MYLDPKSGKNGPLAISNHIELLANPIISYLAILLVSPISYTIANRSNSVVVVLGVEISMYPTIRVINLFLRMSQTLPSNYYSGGDQDLEGRKQSKTALRIPARDRLHLPRTTPKRDRIDRPLSDN